MSFITATSSRIKLFCIVTDPEKYEKHSKDYASLSNWSSEIEISFFKIYKKLNCGHLHFLEPFYNAEHYSRINGSRPIS